MVCRVERDINNLSDLNSRRSVRSSVQSKPRGITFQGMPMGGYWTSQHPASRETARLLADVAASIVEGWVHYHTDSGLC